MISGWEWWLLNWLNNWVAETPAFFYRSLEWSDHAPWLLIAGALAGFWFFGEPGAVPTKPGRLTRLESRRRIILMLGALAVSLLLAQVLRQAIFHARPLADVPLQIPIDPEVWQAVRRSLATQSGFPSSQAAMLFVFTTGIFSLSSRAGLVALIVSGYFCALQVGLGLHWPSDILAGAMIGVLTSSVILVSQPFCRWFLNPIVLQFESRQALAYTVGFLVLFDLSQKFSSLSGIVHMVIRYVGQG